MSDAIATQFAYERANEVCPQGYDIVEKQAGKEITTERVAIFGKRKHEIPEIVMTVRCRDHVPVDAGVFQ